MAGPGGFQPRSGECVIDAWGGMGLLWYAKQQLVSPYTIRAEWRIYGDDDNSGMFIGFPDPLDDPWKPVAQGYEIQIDPTDEAVRKTGAIYSFQGANPAQLALAIKPHGQWNVMEVSVDGQLIVVRLNGVEINRYTSPHPERDPSAGYFGVQNDGAGADVSYRSVQVQGGGVGPTPTPTADAHANPDGYADSEPDGHAHAHADADRHANRDRDADGDAHRHGHSDRYGHREPAARRRHADPDPRADARSSDGDRHQAALRAQRRRLAADPQALRLTRRRVPPAQQRRRHARAPACSSPRATRAASARSHACSRARGSG